VNVDVSPLDSVFPWLIEENITVLVGLEAAELLSQVKIGEKLEDSSKNDVMYVVEFGL
jgi:hypothetical protein